MSFSVSSFNANLSNVMYVHNRCTDQLPPFGEIAAPLVYNIAFVSCLFVLVYFRFRFQVQACLCLHQLLISLF